jgi:hypothetical protein
MKASLLKRSALALILFPLAFALPAQVQAQQKAPAAQRPAAQPRATKMATADEINTYMAMAAINMCGLAAAKVPFKTAMNSSVTMVASVLTDKHGGQIAGAPSVLNRDQIINATVAETILRVDRTCGKSLPADWRKELDPLLAQVRKAMSSQAQPSGTRGK